ncbi:flagellar filament capping protein FliD [Accumulibacter sp.]|uniref:flagellar filament capping protein FliD n=1 Tax=Accumulibacter sp. TaxID=2053492 RepID=UPI002604E31D|nr:flagellar filament capping protein FliD [Accumulibacter sp.]
MSPFTTVSLASSLFRLFTTTSQGDAAGVADGFPALLSARLNASPDAATTLFGQPTVDAVGLSQAVTRSGNDTGLTGLSPLGRNLRLNDPEAGYRMMSTINRRDVTYRAQFAELSALQAGVASLQPLGQMLAEVKAGDSAVDLKAKLQEFVGRYNEWIARFDETVKPGGLLAGTRAAEVSLYELEQSIENPFNGAMRGVHGLRDLGITIDETSNRARFDTAVFDSALARSRPAVLETIGEFGANFARSAQLLNESDNFIPRQLNNLDGVIDYFADHRPALQAEFGCGDPVQPTAKVAQALAAYERLSRA